MADIKGIGNKFIVFKIDDLKKYVTNRGLKELDGIELAYNLGRSGDGKSVGNYYLVINTDEPYADEIINIMKSHGHWG